MQLLCAKLDCATFAAYTISLDSLDSLDSPSTADARVSSIE